jgi:perosamine synthetase
MKILKENNVDTRNFFYPLNKQPALNKIGMFKNEKYPNAEYIAKNGFYIPSGLGTSLSEQNKVIKIINKTLTNEQ